MAEMNETDRQAASMLAELARERSKRPDFTRINNLDERIRLEDEYVQLRDAVVEAAKARHQFYEARTGQELSVELADAEWKAVRDLLKFEAEQSK